jgi:hypothetical protein
VSSGGVVLLRGRAYTLALGDEISGFDGESASTSIGDSRVESNFAKVLQFVESAKARLSVDMNSRIRMIMLVVHTKVLGRT